jgi:hypothetical protein
MRGAPAISGPVFESEDAKEGMSAFVERCDRVWRAAATSGLLHVF